MLIVHRTALRRRCWSATNVRNAVLCRSFHYKRPLLQKTQDPRLSDLGQVIEDQFAVLRDDYKAPKHAIVLAHGLLGFDELHLAGHVVPGIRYWSGIADALAARGVEVITAEVPPSGRIEVRAERLGETIARKAHGKAVNIVA